MLKNLLLFLISIVTILFCSFLSSTQAKTTSKHDNNWAVLVSASRYWFNYRHAGNTLSMYHTIKSLGIPDSQIILMLADDMACNDRNVYKASIVGQIQNKPRNNNNNNNNNRTQDGRYYLLYNNYHSPESHLLSVYDEDIEVDYRGLECNVENLLRVLTHRHFDHTPASKKLSTDSRSNILVYLDGHGGDTFLKFHDKEEIQSQDLADAFSIMHSQGRYNEILFMVDTCQATTLYSHFTAPNIVAIGSSLKGESAYSYTADGDVGVTIADRFTHHVLRFFEDGLVKVEEAMLDQLFNSLTYDKLRSHAEWKYRLSDRDPRTVKVTDFFSARTDVDLIEGLIMTNSSLELEALHNLRLKKENKKECIESWNVLKKKNHISENQDWWGEKQWQHILLKSWENWIRTTPTIISLSIICGLLVVFILMERVCLL